MSGAFHPRSKPVAANWAQRAQHNKTNLHYHPAKLAHHGRGIIKPCRALNSEQSHQIQHELPQAALDVLATAAILAAAAGKADRITAGRKATGDTRLHFRSLSTAFNIEQKAGRGGHANKMRKADSYHLGQQQQLCMLSSIRAVSPSKAVSGKGFTNMKGEPALTDTDGLTKQAAAMIPLSVGV
ncbi:MAG: hypothetical protein FRX49_12541 [Trebouxia sp. A1-2]|nr:MAG: hypothetical protein FRX49_12541 [Trebouxia sp. A1-2]